MASVRTRRGPKRLGTGNGEVQKWDESVRLRVVDLIPEEEIRLFRLELLQEGLRVVGRLIHRHQLGFAIEKLIASCHLLPELRRPTAHSSTRADRLLILECTSLSAWSKERYPVARSLTLTGTPPCPPETRKKTLSVPP